MYGFCAIIFSYVFFLFARSLTKHKLLAELEVPEHKRLPTIDSVIGLKMLADMFVNICFSFIMAVLVRVSPSQKLLPAEVPILKLQRHVSVITSSIALLATFLQIFVSWKTGPSIWTEIAPYIYFVGVSLLILLCRLFTAHGLSIAGSIRISTITTQFTSRGTFDMQLSVSLCLWTSSLKFIPDS